MNRFALFLGAVTAPILASAQGGQAGPAGARAQAPTPDYSLTIRAIPAEAKAGTAINLSIAWKNLSDRSFRVAQEYKNPKRVDEAYRTYVRDEKGNLAPETAWGREIRTGKSEGPPTLQTGAAYRYDLEPGEVFTQSILLNRLYDLSQPGKYTVQVEHLDPQTKLAVKSNVIELSVTK